MVRRAPTIALLAASACVLGACSGSGAPAPSRTPGTSSPAVAAARADAIAFLRRYVQADGRVVRLDQGGDTVSEGQSYGLLLAEVAGDAGEVRTIWDWTAAHLQRRDGLLSYHADAAGRVVDQASATDADLVTAWALVRSGDASLRAAGARMSRAVLAHETVRLPDGSVLLAAGDWATGQPASLNPSYWVFPAIHALAAEVPDRRWPAVLTGASHALATVTTGDTILPPDWVRADGARLSATPAPGGAEPQVEYSFDAQRIPVWEAAGGPGVPRPPPYRLLQAAATAQSLTPGGSVIDGAPSPVAAVASAASAASAGDTGQEDTLLATADRMVRSDPTYYGAAWAALGRALLTTALLQP